MSVRLLWTKMYSVKDSNQQIESGKHWAQKGQGGRGGTGVTAVDERQTKFVVKIGFAFAMPINNGDLLVLGDIGHSADVEIHEVGGSVVDQLGHPSAVGSYGAGQDAAYRGRQIGGRGVATEGHICFVVSV